MRERDYVAHIRRIGEEKKDEAGEKRHPARRWVVERTLAWLSKCRALLVRYDKKARNYLGLIKLACILLWYRRQHRLSLLIVSYCSSVNRGRLFSGWRYKPLMEKAK